MIKRSCFLGIFVFFAFSAFAQQNNALEPVDRASRQLADEIARTIRSNNGTTIVDGFYYQDAITLFGELWKQNLNMFLAEPHRNITLLDAMNSTGRADYLVQGTILLLGERLRIYTSLIKNSDSSIVFSKQSELEASNELLDLLYTSSSSSSGVRRDRYENDSMANPAQVSADGNWIQRTIHEEGDQDWFTLSPQESGLLSAETSGNMDTLMELYENGSSYSLASNDDSGSGYNAKISYYVDAGKTYVIKVSDYGSSTGDYSFRMLVDASMSNPVANNSMENAIPIDFGASLESMLISGMPGAWFSITVPGSGGEARIWTSGNMDTMVELYDSQNIFIDSDDDSGEDWNADLNLYLNGGATYYIKVSEYDNAGGTYTLHTEFDASF